VPLGTLQLGAVAQTEKGHQIAHTTEMSATHVPPQEVPARSVHSDSLSGPSSP
jgi:hypothetical protein